MKLVRSKDNILISGIEEPKQKLYLSGTGVAIFSPSARAWVVPEWAYWGLNAHFHKFPVTGPSAPQPARGNPFLLTSLPQHLQDTLYPFQQDVALRAVNNGFWGMWHDAGVGKTITALAAYRILKAQGKVDGMIVVGPENGRHVWCGPNSDAAKWIHEPGHYLESGGQQEPPKDGIIYTTAAKIFMSPYQTWLSQRLQTRRFILCVDEAHQVSGALSKRFAQVRAWAKWTQYRWLLSATPTANYPDSFWSLYCILTDSDVALDTWTKYFRIGQQTGSASKWNRGRLAGLGRYLSYCTSVIRKADVAPWLPPVTEQIMRIPLSGAQREMYRKLVSDAREEKGKLGSQINTGAKNWRHKLVYLVSMASHPLVGGNNGGWEDKDIAKLDALKMLISSAGDQKMCIWSWHPKVLEWIADRIGRSKCALYHGEVTPAAKTWAVHAFNNDPNIQFFLGNPSAAGTSLNLGAGTVRIFWDLGWSYVQFHQACERINRITRTLPITSYVLIAQNTVEEIMWKAIQRKQELASHITSEGTNETQDNLLKEVLELWTS